MHSVHSCVARRLHTSSFHATYLPPLQLHACPCFALQQRRISNEQRSASTGDTSTIRAACCRLQLLLNPGVRYFSHVVKQQSNNKCLRALFQKMKLKKIFYCKESQKHSQSSQKSRLQQHSSIVIIAQSSFTPVLLQISLTIEFVLDNGTRASK